MKSNRQSKTSAAKKPYTTPKLKKRGTLKNMTLGDSGSNTDGFDGNIVC
jgi:hypothetical protein